MSMNLVTLLYLVASVCFIQALKGLSHPTSSIRGNLFGMVGMGIAMVTTAALIVKLADTHVGGLGWVLLGLVVFGVSAVAWLAALARVPLSVAYPFNALGYIVILTASVVLLHERANVLTWVGSLMVVSGLLIVVLTKP